LNAIIADAVIFAERIMQKIDKHVSVSPRTDRLIEASIQWAERIMRKIDARLKEQA